MTTPALRVGLEIHVPLRTRSKLHCGCRVDPQAAPNTRICPTCTGQPGAKPQGVNRGALERTVMAARVLGAKTVDRCVMQRKHYMYPDLPNNYQRTSTPVGTGGSFEDVGIFEVHVEEDPGAYDPATGVVDLDRCGMPLAEVVTAPDLVSPDGVARFLRTLRLALETNDVIRDGADFRTDVNVSVGDGPRVEVKNVTGARNAARAVGFEADRQRREAAAGRAVARETRHFDEASCMTRPSREKETAAEYRYIPDPDLRPIDVASVSRAVGPAVDVPARLAAAETRFAAGRDEVLAVAEDRALFAGLETLAAHADPPLVFDFVNRVVRGELHFRKRTFGPPLSQDGLRRLVEAQAAGTLTRRAATGVVRAWLDGTPFEAAFGQGAGVIGGRELEEVVERVLAENPQTIRDYHDGVTRALEFLLGQVLKRTDNRADPGAARRYLEHRLGRV